MLHRNDKLISFEELSKVSQWHPERRIVQCHGVFDVLHAGHLSYFESAKKFGDILVVTVTSDRFVNKGPGRPFFVENVRANMLAALECVDFVAVSPHPTAVPSIENLKPHFYVKGPDYRDKSRDVTGGIYAEEAAVNKHSGSLVFTDDETHSSSELLNRYFMPWTKDQFDAIDTVKKLGGEAAIAEALDKISNLKVCLIGEPIVDNYVFCTPESISSKSPSISSRYEYEEEYAGGVLAIANHLADFVKEVHLFVTHGGETYFEKILSEKLDKRIKVRDMKLAGIPTPRKTRYITHDTSQRIFEITDIKSDQWTRYHCEDYTRLISDAGSQADAIVLADFGHGLFEQGVLDCTSKLPGYIALNVQTNSSNYGFNPFTKHKRFSFLSLDTREVRLAYHDRFSPAVELAQRAFEDLRETGASVSMTLGPNGSLYFSRKNDSRSFAPAFADSVVDATGAGDAFFSLVSMLVKVNCPEPLVPFLGNIFAGLKTKIIGNKASVSKAHFVKAYSTILK